MTCSLDKLIWLVLLVCYFGLMSSLDKCGDLDNYVKQFFLDKVHFIMTISLWNCEVFC